jgi:hypothetical protein
MITCIEILCCFNMPRILWYVYNACIITYLNRSIKKEQSQKVLKWSLVLCIIATAFAELTTLYLKYFAAAWVSVRTEQIELHKTRYVTHTDTKLLIANNLGSSVRFVHQFPLLVECFHAYSWREFRISQHLSCHTRSTQNNAFRHASPGQGWNTGL